MSVYGDCWTLLCIYMHTLTNIPRSFNLKTTSQRSNNNRKSSLYQTFRRVQPHDEGCHSNEIQHSTLQRTHMLVYSIFWFNQHQHTEKKEKKTYDYWSFLCELPENFRCRGDIFGDGFGFFFFFLLRRLTLFFNSSSPS